MIAKKLFDLIEHMLVERIRTLALILAFILGLILISSPYFVNRKTIESSFIEEVVDEDFHDLNNGVPLSKRSTKEYDYNIHLIDDITNDRFTKACAIESAALRNPNALVTVYTSNLDQDFFSYKNVRIEQIDLNEVFKSSIVEGWWTKNKKSFQENTFFSTNLKFLLSFHLIYKYGGVYIDTDMMSIQSLDYLLSYSGLCYLNSSSNPFILIFKSKDPFIRRTIQSLLISYKPNQPFRLETVKKEIRSYCYVPTDKHASLMLNKNRFIKDHVNLNRSANKSSIFHDVKSKKCKLNLFNETFFMLPSNSSNDPLDFPDVISFESSRAINILLKLSPYSSSSSATSSLVKLNCQKAYESNTGNNQKLFF